jgi:hypothetical protein
VRQREAPAAVTSLNPWAAALVEPLEAAAKERQIADGARFFNVTLDRPDLAKHLSFMYDTSSIRRQDSRSTTAGGR